MAERFEPILSRQRRPHFVSSVVQLLGARKGHLPYHFVRPSFRAAAIEQRLACLGMRMRKLIQSFDSFQLFFCTLGPSEKAQPVDAAVWENTESHVRRRARIRRLHTKQVLVIRVQLRSRQKWFPGTFRNRRSG